MGKLDDQIRNKEKLKGPGTCGVGKKRDQGRRGKGGVSRRLSRIKVLTV